MSDMPAGIEEFLHDLCSAADRETLPRFRMGLAVENKQQSGFDPVTIADREAERAIRRLIEARFPDHGIIGEEDGAVRADARYCWIIDPVDGTRAFICGLPGWGTLIGLLRDGKPVAGVMAQPYTGERFIGVPEGAFFCRGAERRPIKTRSTAQLADATPHLFPAGDIERYRNVEKACRMARYGFDCYAYAMIAAGQIDLVIESGLQSYDIAPLIPVIERAGGVVTTWTGASAANGGHILASANAHLHEAAMKILNA
jgi:myo-inositol-1(or 4)-monophosphatase